MLHRLFGLSYGVCFQVKVLVVAVSFCTLTPVQQASAEPIWATLEGNSRNNGYSPLNGPTTPVVRWVVEENADSPFTGSYGTEPVVASDGTVYMPHSYLVALNPDGSQKWEYSGSGRHLNLTVDNHDGVYAQIRSLSPPRVIHLNSIGETLPSVQLGLGAVVGPDDTVYGSAREDLRAGELDGSIRWTVPTVNGNPGTIGVGLDGAVYVSDASNLHSVNPATGDILWTYDRQDNSSAHPRPAIADDGTVFTINNYFGAAVALTPQGDVKWMNDEILRGFSNGNSILVDSFGNSYWLAKEYGITALDPDGDIRWIRRFRPQRNAAVVGNGMIYVTDRITSEHSTLLAISTENGANVWSFDAGENILLSDVAVGGDSVLYVSGRDMSRNGVGLLYSLVPEPVSLSLWLLLLTLLYKR